jgi:phosphoribosylamine--glycine ligase
MKRHNIPTAEYGRFDDPDLAARFAREAPFRCVVKADGLAAGKGVVVCDTHGDALAAIDRFARARFLGDAGATLVIEERIEGAEVSFHVLCDGERYVVLGAAQDHKRLLDGDRGPNTGGMGAYSPVALWSAALEARVCRDVVEPTLRGIAKDAAPFRGVLFVGLMITPVGDPVVLEYNVRFGDPECAVLLACLDDDLTPWLLGAARGALPEGAPRRSERSALAVVIAAEGYPDAPRRGVEIQGIDTLEHLGATLYHAGTARDRTRWITAGGRVVLVTATARSAREAATIAYGAVDAVSLPGAQVRRDIGRRAWSHS